MRYLFSGLFCFCLLFGSMSLNAQYQGDLMDLESSLVNKINVYRIENGLSALWNDSVLYVSAKEHGDYLKKNNEKSIFEKSRRNATPQKRAEYYGAEGYMVGEVISILKIQDNTVKDSLVALLFENHISRLNNRAYLLSGSFRIHGVKVMQYSDNELMVIHDLAIPGEQYQYRLCPTLFPEDNTSIPEKVKGPKYVKKYEWKIKAPKKEEDCEGMLDVYNRLRNFSVRQEGKRAKIILDKESIAKQLIDGKKDGIAIEAISFDQYICENNTYYNPGRRNKNSLLNGVLMKPKYHEDIFTESGYRDDKENFFSRGIGTVKIEGEFLEANAVLIKNKKVCKVIGPRKICGAPLNYQLEELPYIDNFYRAEYNPDVEYDTLKMKIYYKPNQIEPDMKVIQEIIDFVQKEGLVISRAYVNANASIEGSKEINESIFNQRADYLLNLFEEKQAYGIRRKIKMQENWSLFYKQIKNTKYAYLELEDTTVVRHIINDSSEYFSAYLDEQRYAQVNLFAVTKATRDQFKVYAMNDFNSKILDIDSKYNSGKTKAYERLIEEAGNIQLFLYDLYIHDEISDDFLRMMKIPDSPEYVTLQFYKLMFDFRYIGKNKRISESTFFERLEKLIKQNNAGALEYYNFLAYILNHYGDDLVMEHHASKKISSYMAKAKDELVPDMEYDKINFHYNYLKAEAYYEKNELSKASASLNGISQYYAKISADTSKIVNLAEYYIQFEEIEDAYKLVKKYFNKSTRNIDLISLYVKLHYIDFWKEERSGDYYHLLERLSEIMPAKDWCALFVGECNLSFQLFDYEPLWKLYCLQSQGVE